MSTYDITMRDLAIDLLDIAVRAHFTQAGIDAVITKLKTAFPETASTETTPVAASVEPTKARKKPA